MAKNSIKVCMGSACFARGNLQNLDYIEKFIKENNLGADVELVGAHCQEKCDVGPNIYVNDVLYSEVNEEKLKEILSGLLVK